MPRPSLTIVLPTRERHDTLRWALETCVSQDYDRLEIIVSDNASRDQTREVVEAVGDPRVRYLNTGRPMSMTENWEFALAHATHDYVGYLGDDDGLMPGAAGDLSEILAGGEAALRWPVHAYYWPSYVDPSLANCLSMRFRQPYGTVPRRSAEVLPEVAAFRAHAHQLPSLYWGVVKRSLLDSVRQRSGGAFFHSVIPDIYSGIVVAGSVDTYLSTDRIYSLSGSSGHSTGASQVTGAGNDAEDSPAQRFEAENSIPFHPALRMTAALPVLVGEPLLQAHDRFASVPEVDISALLDAVLRDRDYLLNPRVRDSVHATLRQIAVQHGLGEHLEHELARERRGATARMGLAAADLILRGNPIVPCGEGVTNIYEATLLADRLRTRSAASAAVATFRGRAEKLRRAGSAHRSRTAVD